MAFLVIGGFLILLSIVIYNRLVSLRNRVKNAFAQIEVQLKRRHDLIPNLVETAKAYIKHERQTLEAVIAARNQAVQMCEKTSAHPESGELMKSLSAAEGQLQSSLGRLLAVVESYPDLKAHQTMGQLMEELTSTENKVSFARQAFNDFVMEFNTAREKFPNSILASVFGFVAAENFSIEIPSERLAPRVQF